MAVTGPLSVNCFSLFMFLLDIENVAALYAICDFSYKLYRRTIKKLGALTLRGDILYKMFALMIKFLTVSNGRNRPPLFTNFDKLFYGADMYYFKESFVSGLNNVRPFAADQHIFCWWPYSTSHAWQQRRVCFVSFMGLYRLYRLQVNGLFWTLLNNFAEQSIFSVKKWKDQPSWCLSKVAPFDFNANNKYSPYSSAVMNL